MKGQPQTSYKLRISYADGSASLHEYSGTLRACLAYIDNHCYGFPMDSYHKVWRELARTGGAYASFHPCGAVPVLVSIVQSSFTESAAVAPLEKDAVSERQRSSYERERADYENQDFVAPHPALLSGWGGPVVVAEQPAAPVCTSATCAECAADFISYSDLAPRTCPACAAASVESYYRVTYSLQSFDGKWASTSEIVVATTSAHAESIICKRNPEAVAKGRLAIKKTTKARLP